MALAGRWLAWRGIAAGFWFEWGEEVWSRGDAEQPMAVAPRPPPARHPFRPPLSASSPKTAVGDVL
jgi:hypothetical protein